MPGALSDTIRGLVEAAAELERDAPSESELATIIARGEFRPSEDEAIGFWFARYLSVRESLWAAIEEALELLDKPTDAIRQDRDLRYFLVGYAAACLLVRIDRLMLFRVADHSISQRKLNEPFPENRIPRKQYTMIFSAFVNERNALSILDAMKFAGENRPNIMRLRADPEVGFIVQQLDTLESSLDPSKRSYLRGALRFVSHKWRRRVVVSTRLMLAGLMEGFGRTASEFCETENKKVDENILRSIGKFLRPGDVIVTRHAKALTNLFLPGFWPHASLYIGTPEQRGAAGIKTNDASDRLRLDDICVLEARKDGAGSGPWTIRSRSICSWYSGPVSSRRVFAGPSIARCCTKARCITSTSTSLIPTEIGPVNSRACRASPILQLTRSGHTDACPPAMSRRVLTTVLCASPLLTETHPARKCGNPKPDGTAGPRYCRDTLQNSVYWRDYVMKK